MKAIIKSCDSHNWYKDKLGDSYFVEPSGSEYFSVKGNGPHAGSAIRIDHCDITLGGREMKGFLEQIKDLTSEKSLLLQQIEAEMDRQKPVVLPANVAEALQCYQDWDIVFDIEEMAREAKHNNPNLSTLYEFYKIYPKKYFSALLNGYTVETLENKIEAAVLKFVQEQSEENVGYIIANDSEEFSQRITEIVTKIIREDQAIQQ